MTDNNRIFTASEIRDFYSLNDKRLYQAILHMMMSKGLTVFTLDEQNQFHLQGTELTVKELRLVKDENPSTTYLEIMAESDKDGEEFEYPLTDDSTTQLDQIELLTILEKI